MTDNERYSVQKLMQIAAVIRDDSKVKSIKQEFLNGFQVDVTKSFNYIIELLQTAYNEKNADDVEYCLFIGFAFDLFTKDFTFILCKLIEVDWHYQHENIASILQMLKAPQSVNSLYHAALLNLKYLEYTEASPLAVKCIWALGEINTDEAKEKIKLLAKSNNEIIRANAIKQLEK